jgi:3-hydroxybutyryl-CoA dehydrogenase
MSAVATSPVGVVGAGTMGVGIAVTVARAGYPVVIHDLDQARVDRGRDQVEAFLRRSVELGKLDAEVMETAVAGLTASTSLEDLAPCSAVIEAIFEDVAVKAKTFGELDDICAEETLFHTNTSTLSVTAIAAGSRHPERVVGTHYCNPAPLMKLVEVVKGQVTSDESLNRTIDFVESLRKTVVQTKDTPGFLVNLFLVPFENDCIRALEAGMGTVESIDEAIRSALRYPMGTFTLLDIVGLDIHEAVSMRLFEQLHDARFAPPPLVSRMISAGQLGRKTGQGFYSYEGTSVMGA